MTASPLVQILDGSCTLPRASLGGKGWSINWMQALGLKVPPAVTITTEAHHQVSAQGHLSEKLWAEIINGINYLEGVTGKTFGTGPNPLLVSVRSGAAESMPGMMDTILNLGINTEICQYFTEQVFAQQTLAIFNQQYQTVVLNDPHAQVPSDVWAQLRGAIDAVHASWNSPRAQTYRQHYSLDDHAGTSVTIQAMVFGNRDSSSGSGVLFSRNPATGENIPYGQWLCQTQGEEIVSGARDPESTSTLKESMPAIYQQLIGAAQQLEQADGDVQDIEFTIENNTLWLLQARRAKRSPRAAVDFAVQLCNEGLISIKEALDRISSDQVRQLLKPSLEPRAVQNAKLLASGEPACPGIASGLIVTNADDAMDKESEGIVLARPTTSPDDIHGMLCARAIITELGGATSHAAVVSREIGVPCVVGCGKSSLLDLANTEVTVDGSQGKIYAGKLPGVTFNEQQDKNLNTLIEWAQALSPISIQPVTFMAPDNAIDIGSLTHGIEDRLSGVESAYGKALDTDEGVRLAIDAGLKTLYVQQCLPALLAAIH